MELLNKDKRDGYTYDVVIKQFDTTFWKQTTGTTTVSSNKLRNNAAAISSYLQHIYGDFEFALNVATKPQASASKVWGLRLPSSDSTGAAYFEISDTTARVRTIDDGGNIENTNFAWSNGVYDAVEVKWRIIWEPGRVQFMIDGAIIATHSTRIPSNALPLRIANADSDNLDAGYVAVRRAASVI